MDCKKKELQTVPKRKYMLNGDLDLKRSKTKELIRRWGKKKENGIRRRKMTYPKIIYSYLI